MVTRSTFLLLVSGACGRVGFDGATPRADTSADDARPCSGTTHTVTENFDDNTLQLLDSNPKVFTNAQLVRLATILKLDTSPQAATAQQRTREATTAEQQPVPSWQEIFGAQ